MRVLLVDLSSVLFPIWKMSGNDPDPNHTSTATVGRIREFARRWEGSRTIVCCDSRRTFRKDVSPEYKANREKKPEDLYYQSDRAKEILAADGLPVLEFDGFEADDVIASCVSRLGNVEALSDILVVSADKDLLQLVRETDDEGRMVPVNALSTGTGNMLSIKDVVDKFGVQPWQMGDWLALVGDTSDNVKGAEGIGDKKAAALLAKFNTLPGVFSSVESSTPEQWAAQFTDPALKRLIGGPAVHASLKTGGAVVALARKLVTLRDDVPVPSVDALLKEPVQTQLAPVDTSEPDPFGADEAVEGEPVQSPPPQPRPPSVPPSAPPASQPRPVAQAPQPVPAPQPSPTVTATPAASTALALCEPVSWQMALEPQSPQQAIAMATRLFDSRLFSGYGNANAILAVMLAGRSMKLDAVTALRGMHLIEGKLQVSASLMVGLCMRSGLCKYFRVVETTPELATYETWRVDHPEPTRYTYTIAMAKQADLVRPTKDGKPSTWMKRPETMLRHRCETELARMVYHDVVSNCYSEDEIEEIQDSKGSRGRAA
jgi:5'-3' exonuclease